MSQCSTSPATPITSKSSTRLTKTSVDEIHNFSFINKSFYSDENAIKLAMYLLSFHSCCCCCCFFFFFSVSWSLHLSTAIDTISPGQEISVNQSIVSAEGVFALGFFSPRNTSTSFYLAIWYSNIPEKTIVWVANRGNPLSDLKGKLTMTQDRNLAIISSQGETLWSTGVSNLSNYTRAILLDSGNLVLSTTTSNYSWQSFDNPTNTFLPNMYLRSNVLTGDAQRITSWRSATDPSSGNFSFGIDPEDSLQLKIWRNSQPHWRSHVWNGKSLSGVRETNTTSQYVLKVSATASEIAISFSPTQGSVLARYVLDFNGTLKMMFWNQKAMKWSMIWSRPRKPCDDYDRCGPSGYCDSNVTMASATCKCFSGFVPKDGKEWSSGDYSGGCLRRVALTCDKGDKFLKMENMKLPDRFAVFTDKSKEQCEEECLFTCACSAYAYANVTGGGSSQRCLLWAGELIDLEHVAIGGEDLYVRLVASEFASSNSTVDGSRKGKHALLIALPTLAAVIFAIFCCCLGWRIYKKAKSRASQAVLLGDLRVSSTFESGNDAMELPQIDYNSVMAATNNFSIANKLGQGGFGPVYKGDLQGQEIAVKRLSKSSGQGYQEFKNEVELIARLQHTNLVRLLGWCMHEDEKLLIYEYLPNKSLDKFLFDQAQSSSLDWGKRFHIIEGIAQGLLYLHRYSRLRIIHRDLKTSNILLDGAMNPKISDFGLARIFGGNQTEANTQRVVGTYGYMSPEYALDGIFSEKSDVFSFGVILLEIVSGQRSTGFYPYRESLNLLGYAWQLWEEGRGLELIDKNLDGSLCASEAMRCMQVGLLCIQENAAERPTMSSVVPMLGKENSALPSPKKPAFAIGRIPNPSVVISSSSSTMESLNEVTLSVVEGR